MEQYISKTALVEKIRSRLHPVVVPPGTIYEDWDRGADSERLKILSIIDTLEVRKIGFTNAFIEKALKWIDYTFHETSIDGFGGESVDVVMSDTSIYKDDLLESFKNYMEGE